MQNVYTTIVSIPHRKTKNLEEIVGFLEDAEFPSLIGRLKTRKWRACFSTKTKFPSLIGRLKTILSPLRR